MSERVIAIDPGERAGWASATLAENSITDIEHGVLPQKQMAFQLYAWQVPEPRFDVVCFESWRPRPKAGSMNWIIGNQLLSAQHVGQIRFIAWLSGAKLVSYGPDRKGVAMASMPEALKQRMKGSHEQHDQDALMHLWLYAFENWVTDPTKLTIDEVR